nr:hypothetical protein BaRGS_022982 [Batillaria attramentaria]
MASKGFKQEMPPPGGYGPIEFLKQLRENRDEENELMKNVEGWKTGTLWGEPAYYNVRDRFISPSTEEYFAHCKYWEKFYAVHDKLNH